MCSSASSPSFIYLPKINELTLKCSVRTHTNLHHQHSWMVSFEHNIYAIRFIAPGGLSEYSVRFVSLSNFTAQQGNSGCVYIVCE